MPDDSDIRVLSLEVPQTLDVLTRGFWEGNVEFRLYTAAVFGCLHPPSETHLDLVAERINELVGPIGDSVYVCRNLPEGLSNNRLMHSRLALDHLE